MAGPRLFVGMLMCWYSKAQPGQEGYKESLLDKAKHAVGLDKQKAEEKK